MKQLTVSFLSEFTESATLSEVGNRLRKLGKQVLSYVPWPTYPYKPDVHFSIAYGHSALLLQYEVKEKFIKAANGSINGPVYQDSCVEFFISLDDGATYYNFEFNCIGTVLAGFGKGREGRETLPNEALEKVRSEVRISRGEGSGVVWEITLAIPLETFLHHSQLVLQGKSCKANFYKCGDKLPEPHFLSWSNIKSEEPDFHLSKFFGALHFQ